MVDLQADLSRLIRFLRERREAQKAARQPIRMNFQTSEVNAALYPDWRRTEHTGPSPAVILLTEVERQTGLVRRCGKKGWVWMEKAKRNTSTWDWQRREAR